MATSLTPEALHAQLTLLLDEKPELSAPGPLGPEVQKWFGRAVAMIKASGDLAVAIQIGAVVKTFPPDAFLRRSAEQQIVSILHIALAQAELSLPAGAKGSFIAAGSAYDAYAAVARVLTSAARDLLLVDAYASDKVLEFALAAPDAVNIRVLGDKADYKTSLEPATRAWIKQHASSRPLEVRLAAPKTLHDRLILVDGKTAWAVGQSFNALATRAHTSISRLEPEIETRKLAAYAVIWNSAAPL